MLTIFDFNPSEEEIESICYDYDGSTLKFHVAIERNQEAYIANIKPEWAIFDLALLFDMRNQPQKAKEYWDKIPELAEQWSWGNDNVVNFI